VALVSHERRVAYHAVYERDRAAKLIRCRDGKEVVDYETGSEPIGAEDSARLGHRLTVKVDSVDVLPQVVGLPQGSELPTGGSKEDCLAARGVEQTRTSVASRSPRHQVTRDWLGREVGTALLAQGLVIDLGSLHAPRLHGCKINF